jgi:hypothetical protein
VCYYQLMKKKLDLFSFYPSNKLFHNPIENVNIDYFDCFVFPATGPRGFVTIGFDYHFQKNFEKYMKKRQNKSIWFLGGSFGAFRSTALISGILQNKDVLSELLTKFAGLYYKPGDTPESLNKMMQDIYDLLVPNELLSKMINYPHIKLAFFVTRIKKPYDQHSDLHLQIRFLYHILGSVFVSKSFMNSFCELLCFYTGDTPPPINPNTKTGDIKFVKLTETNYRQVIHASSCIPFVQEKCTFIDGVGHGCFYDSGICHYMLGFKCETMSLLLSDLPNKEIKQTGIDFRFPDRELDVLDNYFDNCSVVCPNDNLLELIDTSGRDILPNVAHWFSEEYIQFPLKRIEYWYRLAMLSIKHLPNVLKLVNN